ncbi:DUF389 domain-containing protein [Sphingomonas hengshuiensis]|uniref:DUF389 domain-containing protein n=1 Tax=Sphingomonas hengshuiensis TaxID=1609977 RepID=UPI001D11A974|nr:DUF389 domain-containing protein [Sphingomonas hengshuiensis]
MRTIPLALWWRRSIVGSVDHIATVDRIVEDSGWTPRYIFMTLMSAGIAVLGLLLSSPAVVIGAMLISPLMGPILGFGFSIAMFDFAEMRRSVAALAFGSIAAVAFTALIVVASPLKAPTAEILARTRPNLFDLLVALFAALAGTFAIIRGRGETIVGVAIATALMPPLAVVGYGLATWNMPVLGGSFALFVTNFVTIALAAAVLARFYGFGHGLSSQQSWTQTLLLLFVFVAMAVPLAFSLGRIASEAVAVGQIRAALAERFGADARVTQLDVDFDRAPWTVRSVVIAPLSRGVPERALREAMEKRLGRPLDLHIDQVLLDPDATIGAQRAGLRETQGSSTPLATGAQIAHVVGVAAGVSAEAVTIDTEHRRATATAALLPGAALDSYRALEQRASAAVEGWTIALIPPLLPLPQIAFATGADALDGAARESVRTAAWAAQRWNSMAIAVPGLPAGETPARPTLTQRRALAIAAVLREAGAVAAPAPATGSFALTPAEAAP